MKLKTFKLISLTFFIITSCGYSKKEKQSIEDNKKEASSKVELFIDLPFKQTGMFLDGDNLYISLRDGQNISKIDLSKEKPVLNEVIGNLVTPIGVSVHNNILYFASYMKNTIYSFDMKNDIKPKPFLSEIEGPANMFIDGDNFYFIQQPEGKISLKKMNTNDKWIDIASDLIKPTSILKYKNYLYFIETYAGKISRLDLTDPNAKPQDYIKGLDNPYLGYIYENTLYIGEYQGGRISEVNLDMNEPKVKETVSGIDGPFAVVRRGNKLYIAEHYKKRIVTFDL